MLSQKREGSPGEGVGPGSMGKGGSLRAGRRES